MKKRVLYAALVTVLGVNLFLGAQIYFASALAAEKGNLYQHMDTFVRVLEKVRQEYVDGDDLSYEDLIHGALKGMLGSLDPHSEFMEPAKHEDLKNDTEGFFGGVGIVIELRDGFLTVVAPMEDTPAAKAGILKGDRIVQIGGRSTEKMGMTDAVKSLRGAPGTSVTISVSRPAWAEAKDIALTRTHIKVATVKDVNGGKAFPLNEDKVGYVRLTQFGEQTTSDLQDALKKMKAAGMRGLVLDLRGNPGGLLPQAVKVCELFLPKGKLVVSTEGRGAQSKDEWFARGGDYLQGMPMVVLVNSGSASASEIVAGCLQDYERAFIMGEQTFGKGSVQTIYPLEGGAAFRLTTAKYYTPSHKVIHEKGIVPDSTVVMAPDEEEALLLKRSVASLDLLDPERRARAEAARDVQLARAEDFLKATLIKGQKSGAKKVAAKVP